MTRQFGYSNCCTHDIYMYTYRCRGGYLFTSDPGFLVNHLPTKMISPCFLTLVLSTSLITTSSGVTLTQVSQLTTLTYDYIIVGGVS